MMYSTGMPILYPFAAVFYFVLYWVYKFLLLKYYEKTTKFNEELPLYCTHWIKFGVLIHGLIGFMMITNSSLIPNDNFWSNKSSYWTSNFGTFGDNLS